MLALRLKFIIQTNSQDSPVVLESENPMMAKFQEILKEHLLRQLSKIKDQITQIVRDYL